MAEPIKVKADLRNEKVRFLGVSEANPGRPVQFDYAAPLGDGDGFAGLELLLLSLAGCSGTAVAYLARKMGKTVKGLTVNVKGWKTEKLPLKFERIELEFVLTSPDTAEGEMNRIVGLTEESVCPVWAMIRGNAEVKASFRLLSA